MWVFHVNREVRNEQHYQRAKCSHMKVSSFLKKLETDGMASTFFFSPQDDTCKNEFENVAPYIWQAYINICDQCDLLVTPTLYCNKNCKMKK